MINVANAVRKLGTSTPVTNSIWSQFSNDIIKNSIFKKVAPRVHESLHDFEVRLYSFNLFVDSRN